MRKLTFRPLRRIKKIGKISTPSYRGWNQIRTADYSQFELTVDTEYQSLPDDEFVYDHKGQLLYFFQYTPGDIPLFSTESGMEIEEMHSITTVRAIQFRDGNVSYSGDGIDCQGTPCFSHYTADYIAESYPKRFNEFEPLTVAMVKEWYGWFLLNLENAKIFQKG